MACLLVPFSMGVFLLAVLGLAVLPRRLKMGICNACGYSLQGLPAQGVCPECGARFNTLWTMPRLPKWGTTVEHVALGVMPIAIGVAIAGLGVAASWTSPSPGVYSLFAVAAGGVSIVPGLVLALIARLSVGRAATWLICISASLPGAVIAASVFIAATRSLGPYGSEGIVTAPIYGATASALIGGLVACAISIREEIKVSRLRAQPAGATTPDGAKLGPNRTDQV